MTRALAILAAIAALAGTAAPASAASSRKPPPRGTTGVVTDNKDPDKLGTVYAAGARVIDVVSVKYTAVNAMFFPWDMASKASTKRPTGIIAILIG